MSPETGEQFGFMYRISDPSADTGSIVEDQNIRYTTDIMKDIDQSLTYAFGCLTTEHLIKTVITEWK